jgi:hypothetical protein
MADMKYLPTKLFTTFKPLIASIIKPSVIAKAIARGPWSDFTKVNKTSQRRFQVKRMIWSFSIGIGFGIKSTRLPDNTEILTNFSDGHDK